MKSVVNQKETEEYSIYNGDCCVVLPQLPSETIHLSVYSPPFAGLYNYSSSDRDLSNSKDYAEFFEHYDYVVEELHRLTLPGRLTGVHCMEVPDPDMQGRKDFPGDIIRQHERIGWRFVARYCIWKEPLGVRNRTMARGLAHKQIVVDSSKCDTAAADYLLMFRKKGENPVPIDHPTGFLEYYGARQIPRELQKYRGWEGDQKLNKYSHWIWRNYASCFWDDIRIDNVLPYRKAKDQEDEKHVHPLQLDVIQRCVHLWSNPGEVVLTPFMGVGSEVYGAVKMGRKGIGIELKKTYYRQAVRNLEHAKSQGNKGGFV